MSYRGRDNRIVDTVTRMKISILQPIYKSFFWYCSNKFTWHTGSTEEMGWRSHATFAF